MSRFIRKSRRSVVAQAAGCVVESLEARQLLYTPIPAEFAIKVGEMSINSRTEPGATGYVKSLAVEAGRTYWLKASGPVTMGPSRYGDAEYFDTQTSTPGDYKPDRGDFGVRLMGDQGVNGSSPYKWGNYESAHVYTMRITAPADLLTAEFVDSNHSDNSGSVKVEVFALPQVSVVATDANASENYKDPGEFTITRSGPATASDFWVYFRLQSGLSGEATPPQYDQDHALLNPDEADFDISGADFVDAEEGIFKAKIAQGQSAVLVTVTPRNDAAIEGIEDVHLILIDDVEATAPSYAAPGLNAVSDPSEAIAQIGDVQMLPGSDDGAPTTQTINGWVMVIISDASTQEERNEYTSLLKAAFDAHPSIEEYLDDLYDYALSTSEGELTVRLEQVLGPVRVRLQGSQLVASLRFESGAAPFGCALRLPTSDEDLGFSVPGQPDAAGIVVGGNPTAIDLTPHHEFADKTISLQVEYLDENGDAITPSGYRRDFIVKSLEVNTD